VKTEAPPQVETIKESSARNAGMALSGVETGVTTHGRTKAKLARESGLMEVVCERDNLKLAYQRVMENKGAAGVVGDGRILRLIRRYLSDTLKLTVNAAKSAVARPWKRKFLGYSLTWHKAPRLRIAAVSLKRPEDNIRKVLKGARGRSLNTAISELNAILRGWLIFS